MTALTAEEIRAEIERQRRKCEDRGVSAAHIVMDPESARVMLESVRLPRSPKAWGFGAETPEHIKKFEADVAAFTAGGHMEILFFGLNLIVLPADGPLIRVVAQPGEEMVRG